MYLIFIGATNVGSMKINFDHELVTNDHPKTGYRSYQNLKVDAPYTSTSQGVSIKKGDEIGRFEMGIEINYCRFNCCNDI